MAILGRPEFALYLAAAVPTLVGVWVLESTLQWIVFTDSGHSTFVGVLLAATYVPIVFLVIPVGLALDRRGAKMLVIASQVIWVGVATTGFVLNSVGHLTAPSAIILGTVDGICNATWTVPAQVLLGRVVRKELMASAIGLGLVQFAGGRVIGGSLAAITLAHGGPATALAVAGAGAAVGAIAAVRIHENMGLERRSLAPEWPSDIRRAFSWTLHSRPATALLRLGGCCALFATSYQVLLPGLSKNVLHAGPAGLGAMMAAGGVGLGLAAFATGTLWRRLGHGASTWLSLVGSAAALALLATSGTLITSLLFVCIAAGCLGVFTATANSLLQVVAPPEMRGRVLSFYGLVVWLLLPIGSVAVGEAVDRLGPEVTLVIEAGLTLAAVIVSIIVDRHIIGGLRIDIDGVTHFRAARAPISGGSVDVK
jgi:MFS family permease